MRPRASAAAVLTLTFVFGFVVVGCGDASRPPDGADDRRPTATADSVRPPAAPASPEAGTDARDSSGGAVVGDAGGGPVEAVENEDSSPQEFRGTAGVTEKKREVKGVAVLRGVRTASHPSFDRVVFEFDGEAAPGYRVEYVDRPVRQCGSGRPVRVAGDGWLLVRLEPASAHTESGEPTVKDRERRPGYPNMKELKLICDFEAQVEWVLGLASPKRYRVLELRNPTRLVLDVKR